MRSMVTLPVTLGDL